MQDRYLRTGIFLAPFHALGENPTLAIERDMELVEHLDRLNYHEAWIGEHHSGGFEIIACPEMFLAAAAQRTRNIRLGTGVVSLPYHHPFTLASRMMQLDHMARGRAMFGVGPGALIYDADKIGLKAADQRRRMNEVARLHRRADAGRHGHPHDRLVRAERGAAAADVLLAAHHGDGGRLLALAGRRSGIGQARHRHAVDRRHVRRGAAGPRQELVDPRGGGGKAGKTADRSKWRIVTFAHVAETREKARADMAHGLADFCRYFTDVATFPIVPPGIADPVEFLTSSGLACIGTPDDCIRHFERLWLGSDGGFGAVLLLAHNWADWEATRRSYELMARYVHPHFQRQSNALRVASYDNAKAKHETAGAKSAQAVLPRSRSTNRRRGRPEDEPFRPLGFQSGS